ncbi:tRNA(1)(Val) (adenine(37)-N(6))-methyltransferase TrmN [Klebsiella sp. BIGb0407]|uniref:tRNA(1)(Val) (adenine(37)-N(6))-methyltransferase TrmN n=1 Tax=Klebsiella sp. BIGb0407 TaxID=2940603 RepID=UPI002168E5C7|nr:tRNA1(Val) (adenine(37)-N6)-methyltransferase [Klebsiella sp. BIGb0407]MCS3432026.1 tRNA1Val (adenine37-N6)-methyltransferase [Klebsiella sp. BIGb0407]
MSVQKAALRGNGFTFKQFFVAHENCAMKVGTDGVLLGAWAPVTQVDTILDIGTGSGLLALMLAQRTPETSLIDAVELDTAATQQAQENVQASPWASRITVHQADICHWAPPVNRRYSLIVSNPPYFEKGSACSSAERAQARYTTTLSYPALLSCARQWITDQGLFCLILPAMTADEFITQANQLGWQLRLRTDVAGKENRPLQRVLLGLSLQPGALTHTELAIRGADNLYSPAHCQLTRDFYLYR